MEHARRTVLALSGDAEHAAHHDRRPRHLRLTGRNHESGPGALDPALLRLQANHEARFVGKRDQRQVEHVAKLDQPNHLRAALDVGRAALMHRIVRHHPDRIAVNPSQSGNPRTPIERSNLKERAFVDAPVNRAVTVIGPSTIPRHQPTQALFAPVRIVSRLNPLGHLVDALRQIAQELANLPEGVLLVLGQVVDRARLVDVDALVAQVLLRNVVAQRRLNDRRTAGEELRNALHHDREVGHAGIDRRQSGDRTHHGGNHWRHAHQLHVKGRPRVAVGQIRATKRLKAAHRAAGRVEHPHIRHPPLKRPLIRVLLGAETARRAVAAARAAANRKVAGRNHDLAPINLAKALNRALRGKANQLARVVMAGPSHQRHKLAQRARIKQTIKAFINKQLAPSPLSGNALSATPSLGKFLAFRNLRNFRFPCHQQLRPC